jgi:hypothetical protein
MHYIFDCVRPTDYEMRQILFLQRFLKHPFPVLTYFLILGIISLRNEYKYEKTHKSR